MISKEEFIRDYSKAIIEKQASVFAGAGLSRSSGFVDWKELLRPLASDINLDVDKETDLVSVAQYYKNERNRGAINQKLMNAFTKNVEPNENVRILTRLPIATYWTTNYDGLIERGLEECNRRPDVKYRQSQLSVAVENRDAIVYKMHGDISDPSEAVLTKDDYEKYDQNRSLFRTALQGELVSKTFLFVGFSFEDPNLEFVLGKVHSQMNDNTRTHYCFFKKVSPTEEDYEYKKCRQELKIHDLSWRYAVQTVLLDNWDEITQILRKIENNVKQRNVFISGSAAEYTAPWTQSKIEELAYTIAQKLVTKNYRITTGFGVGIGSAVINGALDEIYKTKYRHTDEYLCLRPFPQNISDSDERQRLYTVYREEMIGDVGAAVFISGNKKAGTGIVNATGCLEEYKIAKDNDCILIPIGSTGYVAKSIIEEMKASITDYDYLKDEIDILEKSEDVNELANTVVRILGKHGH